MLTSQPLGRSKQQQLQVKEVVQTDNVTQTNEKKGGQNVLSL